MRNWQPSEWSVFLGAVGLLLGTLTTSVIAIIHAARAKADAAEAKNAAARANCRLDRANQQ